MSRPRDWDPAGNLLSEEAPRRTFEIQRLGRVPYARGLEIQEGLIRRRRAGEVPDQLLLLEHPHVLTLGSGARVGNVLVDPARRAELDLELAETGRGGDVTYHGPGQLVAYPILDLKPDRKDVHRYLRSLEEVVVRVLASYEVEGRRIESSTGVWTDSGKVAAIGIRISSGWITSHGFALNVSTDLSYFDTIIPCGLSDRSVTSLERILGRVVPMEEVMERTASEFGTVFGAAAQRPPGGGGSSSSR
jgi:lipoyl(octanoyl) transferase